MGIDIEAGGRKKVKKRVVKSEPLGKGVLESLLSLSCIGCLLSYANITIYIYTYNVHLFIYEYKNISMNLHSVLPSFFL